jgi:hypothetical protein
VANNASDFASELPSQPRRRSASCDSPWFEHDDALAVEPRCVEESQRNSRGLARAWWRLQDGRSIASERLTEVVEDLVYGEQRGHWLA